MTFIPLSDLGPLAELASLLLSPASRLYLLSIFGIFPIAWLLASCGHIHKEDVKSLFDRQIWWHPSARTDYLIIAANALIRSLIYLPTLLTKLGFAAFIYGMLSLIYTPSKLGLAWELQMVIFSLVMFVADDFSRFATHWLQHRVSWLWHLHRWHHNAEVMTPLTLLRTHPLEMLMMRIRSVITGGTVIGVFYYICGTEISGLEILGVDALGFLFNALGANLRHSHVRWSYGKFEAILISPAQHQLHHDRDNRHPVNLGSCLSIWDRLAGSFKAGSKDQQIRFGLTQSVSLSEKTAVHDRT